MFDSSCIVLVTGASSGIGKSIALELNALGATVLACGRHKQRLEEAKNQSANPLRWVSLQRDFMTDPDALPEWITQLRKEYGKLWGFAHAAGQGIMDSLQTYDLHTARQHFDINFHIPLMLAKGFCDRRNFVKGGAMLFVTSSSAPFPEKGHLAYGAAKAALANAAVVISQEMASRGLRVNCLAPGIVDTPLQQQAEQFMGPRYREEQLARYPLGFGTPEDIAYMACFLLSSNARWITGQQIVLGWGCY